MSGNRNIELVTTTDHQIQVYVLDPFRNPLSVAAIHGTALVKGRFAAECRSALGPEPAGAFLRATETTRKTEDEEVAVTLDTPDVPLTMNLPFPTSSETAETKQKPSSAGHHH